MLAPNLALMRFTCPSCQTPLHVSIKLSRAQQELLRSQQHATASRRASRGKASVGVLSTGYDLTDVIISYSALQVVEPDTEILQILVAPPTSTPEARMRLQDFHELLEQIDSVDEAIQRIDSSRQPGDAPEQRDK